MDIDIFKLFCLKLFLVNLRWRIFFKFLISNRCWVFRWTGRLVIIFSKRLFSWLILWRVFWYTNFSNYEIPYFKSSIGFPLNDHLGLIFNIDFFRAKFYRAYFNMNILFWIISYFQKIRRHRDKIIFSIQKRKKWCHQILTKI